MPTKRVLITLADIKKLILKRYKLDEDDLHIFNRRKLYISDFFDNQNEITDNHYMFQFDREIKCKGM